MDKYLEDQHTVARWAVEVAGRPTPSRIAARANEEMAEMLSALAEGNVEKAAEEAADVVIVLYHASAMMGIDLHAQIDRKMAVNRTRKWQKNEYGVAYHVKG